jgi:excisionase family DNA binding protein
MNKDWLQRPLFTLTVEEFIKLTGDLLFEQTGTTEKNHISAAQDKDNELNIAELAKFLRCSKVTIHKYKKAGLPYYKIGRKILFNKSEVLEFMRKKPAKPRKLHHFVNQSVITP